MRRKGATPPNHSGSRAERVVRDLHSGVMSPGMGGKPRTATTTRRRRHSSESSREHPASAASLLSSPSLHHQTPRVGKVSFVVDRHSFAPLFSFGFVFLVAQQNSNSVGGAMTSTGSGGSSSSAGQLMYRSVVGYLGTIEMPEDSGGSSQSSPGSTGGGGLGMSGGGSAAARLAAIR